METEGQNPCLRACDVETTEICDYLHIALPFEDSMLFDIDALLFDSLHVFMK